MYVVYILQSQTSGRFYIGHTKDLVQRLKDHNRGSTKSTKGRGPWKVVYKEQWFTKQEAWSREHKIKSYKGGEAFKKLLL
ncbi:MAG TPA: GIY-YIG nuclease family protein [Patescibacteria group bacterium]|nr:GIY-YIG nuclease family protein [Patescibacteria group bacterium]